MNVKRIGRAEIDLENELWCVEGRAEKFHMNLRYISAKPEVKAARAAYTKLASKDRPPMRKPNKRADFLKEVSLSRILLDEVLRDAFEAVRKDSYENPLKLWKDKDFGRKMDWRFCLYKGVIYQFDHQNYPDERMIGFITTLEASRPAMPQARKNSQNISGNRSFQPVTPQKS